MDVTRIEGRPVFLVVPTPPCTECEDEKARKPTPEEAASGDRVSLSREGLFKADRNALSGSPSGEESDRGPSPELKTEFQLTQEERRVLQELRARDREVRAHEQAHKAAAGPYAQGGPSFEYTTGPDGKKYAVSGEVKIDSSPVPGNPEATLQKARTIKRAATAPRDPSPQDRRVAAQAAQMEAKARQEIRDQRLEAQTEAATGAAPSVSGPRGPSDSSGSPAGGLIRSFETPPPRKGNRLDLFS